MQISSKKAIERLSYQFWGFPEEPLERLHTYRSDFR